MRTTTAKNYLDSPRRSAHRVEAGDGRVYLIRPVSGRQGLAGKVLGPRLAKLMNIPSVETAIVELDDEFVRRAQAACASETARASIKAGRYFGSALPADPRHTSIYDLLPPNAFAKVANIRDLSVMRPFDIWIGNATTGQAVFVRYADKSFLAHMVGFGDCLSSANSPTNYLPVFLIADHLDWNTSEAAVPLIEKITIDMLDALTADIPEDWWRGHDKTRDGTLRWLCDRQRHLAEMLWDYRCRNSREPMRKPPGAADQTIQASNQSSAEADIKNRRSCAGF
jgi:hypothetical protein